MNYTTASKILVIALCSMNLAFASTLRFENPTIQLITVSVSQTTMEVATSKQVVKQATQTAAAGQVAAIDFPYDKQHLCLKYVITIAPVGQSPQTPRHVQKAANTSTQQWGFDRKQIVDTYKQLQAAMQKAGKKIGDPIPWDVSTEVRDFAKAVNGFINTKTQVVPGFSCTPTTYTILYTYDFKTNRWIANLLD